MDKRLLQIASTLTHTLERLIDFIASKSIDTADDAKRPDTGWRTTKTKLHYKFDEHGNIIEGPDFLKGKSKKDLQEHSQSGNIDLPKDDKGRSFKYPTAENVSIREAAKIGHEINSLYHSKYKGKRIGIIRSYNLDDGECYNYRFEIHGFGSYNIFEKKLNEG